MNKKFGFAAVTATALLAGCASMAVTNDALTQRTSQALGIPAAQFSISDRTDSGTRTDYNVVTDAGKHYSCYVTGTVSVTGRVISDAMCTKVKNGNTTSNSENDHGNTARCNALLKAAGKCD